ncbi:MAG TPA: Ig-like domain-containing protein, partial [Pyrinomonadaceae bacterium]|nr:Ig-like domain-containing protein [Pyrinomonadaceae bacterium]
DLSPDGNTLVVADRTHDASNLWVHVVDLRTGAATKALAALEYMEGGTFTVAFGGDNQVLVTSRFEGSGWTPLRKLNPATGEWTKLNSLLLDSNGELSQDAMLAASGDRSVVGFAEANISDGRWGSYKVSDSTLAHRTYAFGTGWFNYEIGVNKNGTQYAIPTFGGTLIYNASFAQVATVGAGGGGARPLGVVYHPVEDLVYFPFTSTTQVRAFNTNTFAQTAAYDFQDTFQSSGNFAFRQGRMKMSRDGSLLFCTVTGGVRFLRLYGPLAASNRSVLTQANRPAAVTLAGSIGNGGALSYRVETQPAHGTLSGTAPNLVYTPETNYEGSDSFTYRSLYGPAESAPATVSVTVTPANQAPTANDQSVTVDEDGSVTVTITASDPDSTLLMYALGDRPAHGTLSTNDLRTFVYTPARDYNGPDGFTFTVTDGAGSTGSGVTVTGHIYITVNNVNDAPTAASQSLATDEDTPLSITLAGADIDGDAPSFMVFAPPLHGTLSGTMPNLVYTPARDYNGPDSFGFKATDGSADSNDAAVQINVRAVNDAPVPDTLSRATPEDTPLVITLSGTDPDGDAVSFAVVTQPAHGTLGGLGGASYVYTPAADYNGPDSFTFNARDGAAVSAAATVSINVVPVNDAPTAGGLSVTTKEDTTVAFTLNGSDIDGDEIGFVIASGPAHGTLTGSAPGAGPNFTYTPFPDYNGPDSFSFKTSDRQLESGVATVSINVTPVNDAPVPNNLTLTTDEDTSVPVTFSGTDPDGDAVTYYLATIPAHGNLSGAAPNYTYNPLPNYNGTETFTYRADDGTAVPVTATVTITVRPVEDAPAADRQNLTGDEDTALPVTLTGSDPDGDALSYAVTAGP